MESAQSRVQDAVTDMVNTLDKEHIRKLQSQMYRCSLKCCENDRYSMEDVQHCLDRCAEPVTKAQNYFQQEIATYQNRLQRCALDCQDRIRDRLPPNATESDIAPHRAELERCAIKCADDHVALVPSMMKRMKEMLKNTS